MAYSFRQARNYTRVSDSAPRTIEVVVIHTMEYPERPTGAEWAMDYFATTTRQASSHYNVDNDTITQSVLDKDVAWAAPGCNHNGLQIEHAGYAAQGRVGWADAYSQAMLRLSADLVASKCKRYGLPVRWLTVDDLKSGRRGITSHNNVSLAFRKSTHTDPGPDFPINQYLTLVMEALAPEEDELTKERVLELEKAAKDFRVGGDGPGPLTEAENAIYYGFLRQFNEGAQEAAPELAALRVKIANAKAALT